jgi:hypothetical protein
VRNSMVASTWPPCRSPPLRAQGGLYHEESGRRRTGLGSNFSALPRQACLHRRRPPRSSRRMAGCKQRVEDGE